jgi:hypothetical protein
MGHQDYWKAAVALVATGGAVLSAALEQGLVADGAVVQSECYLEELDWTKYGGPSRGRQNCIYRPP